MSTIGESVSRVRGILKASNEDSFLTDRFVYSIIAKYGKALIKREQNKRKLMDNDELFSILPFVELIEVDKIEADCAPIKSNCIIKRTKNKLPKMVNGARGPLIRNVYSIDGSYDFKQSTPLNYISLSKSTNFKYNKQKYFWFRNGHLYFPDLEGKAIMIEAIWEDSLGGFCVLGEDEECLLMQDKDFPLPDYLFAEIEQMAEQEFGIGIPIPDSGKDDNQEVLRQ